MKKKLTNKGELTTELLALVNDGDVKDIINLNAASLEKHMEELCTACMLAADTEASQILLDGIAEKSDSFQPRSRQLIANAYEYFDIMRQKGGWRPITMQCDDADRGVSQTHRRGKPDSSGDAALYSTCSVCIRSSRCCENILSLRQRSHRTPLSLYGGNRRAV